MKTEGVSNPNLDQDLKLIPLNPVTMPQCFPLTQLSAEANQIYRHKTTEFADLVGISTIKREFVRRSFRPLQSLMRKQFENRASNQFGNQAINALYNSTVT